MAKDKMKPLKIVSAPCVRCGLNKVNPVLCKCPSCPVCGRTGCLQDMPLTELEDLVSHLDYRLAEAKFWLDRRKPPSTEP